MGDYQQARMDRIRGQSDLILNKGVFYLGVVVNVQEVPAYDPVDVLGVDLGVKNIAVDSDGEIHSSKQLRDIRNRSDSLKARLQSAGTKSAKRHLRKLSGKMAGFTRDVNHKISKKLVTKAKDTSSLISLEDIVGIRKRITVSRSQRRDIYSWSFDQLRRFVIYKAAIAGVPLVLINPAYTSQECPICHCISKSNRPTRDDFCCTCCGFSGPADSIAATNIAARVAVNLPIVSRFFAQAQALPVRVG
jgi:IS605 OrfB family transposase